MPRMKLMLRICRPIFVIFRPFEIKSNSWSLLWSSTLQSQPLISFCFLMIRLKMLMSLYTSNSFDPWIRRSNFKMKSRQ